MNSFEAFASEDGVNAAMFPRSPSRLLCLCVLCGLHGNVGSVTSTSCLFLGWHTWLPSWSCSSLPPLPPRQIIPSTGSSPQISRHAKHLPVRPPLTHQRRSATKADSMFWGSANQSLFFFLLLSWNNSNHAHSLPQQKGSFLGGILIK